MRHNFDNFYYLYQNNKSDTNTFLFNKWSAKKKKDTKEKRANPAPPKNRSVLGGAASPAGMPSQLLLKLEPSIFL